MKLRMWGAGTGTDFDQMMIELQNVSLPPPVEDVLFGMTICRRH